MPRAIREQVIVLTGASSGIGRETALELARRGATVVLAARNEAALAETAHEVERLGGRPLAVPTDVSSWEHMQRLAQQAIDTFGRIDTWINDAGVIEYATVEQMTVDEIERILRVILLGEIFGMKAALPHMRRAGQGAIINISSMLAKRSMPLLSAYSAAKHGILGFSEALRLELRAAKSNITVTDVLPGSINTPLFAHARSKLGVLPLPVPPIYEPRVAAGAIVSAIERPQREMVIGGAAKALLLMQRISPALLDRMLLFNNLAFKLQRTHEQDDGRDNLFAPMDGTGATTGQFGARSKSVSVYTRLIEEHPARKRLLAGALVAGAAVAAWRVAR